MNNQDVFETLNALNETRVSQIVERIDFLELLESFMRQQPTEPASNRVNVFRHGRIAIYRSQRAGLSKGSQSFDYVGMICETDGKITMRVYCLIWTLKSRTEQTQEEYFRINRELCDDVENEAFLIDDGWIAEMKEILDAFRDTQDQAQIARARRDIAKNKEFLGL